MTTTQLTNQPRAQLLSVDLVGRNEPNYAWGQACASILALPALRAFWPMSSVDYTAASRARDIAGGAYHLSDNNTVLFGYDQLAPYAEFDGVNQYLSRADGGAANWADITGTEAYIIAAQRGLTLGGWFYFDNVAAATETAMSKYNTAGNQRSYRIIRTNVGVAQLAVSLNGIAATTVSSIAVMGQNSWYFVVGRFTPGTELKIWVQSITATNAVAIPASVFDGTSQFAIGAQGNPSNYLDGKASLCFLCAAALSDSIITALYHQTRKLYNV